MRNSAVGQAPPMSENFPTTCPWCGRHELAYQYEEDDGVHDVYQCQGCWGWSLVRDVYLGTRGSRRRIKKSWR